MENFVVYPTNGKRINELAVDLDGSPRAYAYDAKDDNRALDLSKYAKSGGDWDPSVVVFIKGKVYVQPDSLTVLNKRRIDPWANWMLSRQHSYDLTKDTSQIWKKSRIVTDTIRSENPYKGMVIAKSRLRLGRSKTTFDTDLDLSHYVNSEIYPYFVMEPTLQNKYGMYYGDYAYVENIHTNTFSFAVFGDSGPKGGGCGEGSLKLLQNLGYRKPPPHREGLKGDFRFILFPKSKKAKGYISSPQEVKEEGENCFRRYIMNDKAQVQLFKSTVAYKNGFH